MIERWQRLFGQPLPVAHYHAGAALSQAELEVARERVELWRQRLMDLSWFMRCLNKHLARKANVEDNCTGRFWEGRFKSQALLGEAALLTCMSYVDLDPVRTGIAATPEESDFTSMQARIRAYAPSDEPGPPPREPVGHGALKLLAFGGDKRVGRPLRCIPFGLEDYLALVDWAGRAVVQGKRGAIPAELPPILARLTVDPEAYVRHLRKGRRALPAPLGPPAR